MDSPLQILIAHYLADAVSGAERSIADFVSAASQDLDVTMLVPGEGSLAEFYRQKGIRVWVERVETPRRLLPGLHTWQSHSLARQLKKRGFAAVIANTFPAASRVQTAARLAGLPLGIYVREYISDQPLHRRLLARADRVFTISQDLREYIQAMTDRPEKVILTYNYINPAPILAALERHRASEKRAIPVDPAHPVIGLIGRITRFKQPDVFIRAAAEVLAEAPEARFVVVGSPRGNEAAYGEELRALVQSLGLSDRVLFLGNRKDNIEITSELAVSCLASTREPLGRTILEANLVGTPVVVSDVGGPAEIVAAEETGLTFSPTAPDASSQLARQILRLLRDPALRERLVEGGRARMQETFASLNHVRHQEDEIRALCQINLPQHLAVKSEG